MKLTEAKLKQMILEAIKDSSFRSFGVSTPDEKLRSMLGDEKFDKLQQLDQNQSDLMKQTLDPDYPERIEQESLYEMLEDAGFRPYSVGDYTKGPTMHDKYNSRSWTKGKPFAMGSSEFKTMYSIFEDSSNGTEILAYSMEIGKRVRYGNRYLVVARGKIAIPPMFDLNLKTKEGLREADSIILSKEKQEIEEVLEEYK